MSHTYFKIMVTATSVLLLSFSVVAGEWRKVFITSDGEYFLLSDEKNSLKDTGVLVEAGSGLDKQALASVISGNKVPTGDRKVLNFTWNFWHTHMLAEIKSKEYWALDGNTIRRINAPFVIEEGFFNPTFLLSCFLILTILLWGRLRERAPIFGYALIAFSVVGSLSLIVFSLTLGIRFNEHYFLFQAIFGVFAFAILVLYQPSKDEKTKPWAPLSAAFVMVVSAVQGFI